MDDCYTPRSAGRTAGYDTPVAPLPPFVTDQPPADSGPHYPVAPLPPFAPDPSPVAPLPPYVENPGPDYPVVPLPPFAPDPSPVAPLPPFVSDSSPVYPVVPLPPFVENPGPSYPVTPLPPIVGSPGVVVLPSIINPRYCTVRFMNAASGYDPLRITVSPRVVANGLNFGALTDYMRVADGFRLVTITSTYSPNRILYQQTIPFRAGELSTMAVVRGNSGLDLVRISDMPCNNIPRNRSCIRAVNLAYQAPPLDVFLSDGRLVFSDVRYKEATDFKQAMPRDYSFYIAQTPFIPLPSFQDIETIEDTPMVAPDFTMQGSGVVNPIVYFYVDAKPGAMYSIYILGTWYNSPNLRIRIVEDFFA